MTTQTLELYCCPNKPLPEGLLEKALKDTGLEPRKDASHVYGNWAWDYSDVSPTKWKAIGRVLGRNIRSLYHRGLIRGGQW